MLEIKNDASLFEGFDVEEQKPVIETTDKVEDGKAVNLEINSSTDLGKEIEANLKGESTDDDPEEKPEEAPENKEDDKPEDNKPEENKVDDSTDDSDEQSYSFKAIAEYLSAEGVVDADGLEDLEDNPEVLTYVVEKSVDKRIKEYKESLPPLVAQLAEYLENGGDESKFIETLAKPIDYKTIDLENEANQELVVRKLLQLQELDATDIDDLIESYKDSLTLEKQATIATKQLSKVDNKRTEQLVKEQELEAAESQKKVDEYISTVKSTITNTKQLAGLNIEDKEKTAFTDYILKRNPKTGLTKYQEELNENYVQNSIELAYLKFKKYDFSKVEKKAESEAAKKLKAKVFGKNESAPKGKSKESVDQIDFSAFRSMFGKSK